MWCSNTHPHVVVWHEATICFDQWSVFCVQVKHRRMSNIRCMIWEHRWTHAKFIDNGFCFFVFCLLLCNKKLNRDWRFKWRQKVSYIVRLYSNTQIMTVLKWIKVVLHWWDWWWTNADFMRHHLELFINSYTFFLHKKPTCKTIDEECWCCYREPNALWVLTSIKPRDNHRHVHMPREIFET